MIVETKYGKFELLKDERNAFAIDKFEQKYLPEYFDKYPYIVGDLADENLRLKGFTQDAKASNYFHCIPDYIVEGCAYNCRYYVLKRIRDNQAEQSIEEIVPLPTEEKKPKEENNNKQPKVNKQVNSPEKDKDNKGTNQAEQGMNNSGAPVKKKKPFYKRFRPKKTNKRENVKHE